MGSVKRKLQNCAKETKLQKGKLVLNHQIKKQGESQVRGTGNLRKLARCENSQAAKICTLRNLQIAKFCNPQNFARLILQYSIILLRNSSELIMNLQIQLRLDVFKSN